MLRWESRLCCLLLVSLMLAVIPQQDARAQAVTGVISGTVIDPQGSVVPGATATVINESTSDTRVAVTDARGDFQITNLQPGAYLEAGTEEPKEPARGANKVE